MIRRVLVIALVAAAAGPAHEPITTKLTWTREISRIVYRRCVSCHREGGKAPMSLVNYEEARPWAKAIREEVLERRMPPWGAVKGFGEFRDDASLSDIEISWLAQWVEGGAPKGDDIYLPRPPDPAPAAGAPPRSSKLALRDRLTLPRDLTAIGIAPQAAPLRATAFLPGGVAVPLVWIQNRTPHTPAAYFFREQFRLPKGTQIRVTPPDSAPAALLIAASKPAR